MRMNKSIFKPKGSALMQVLVLGTIIAALSVMMLRYSVTRSSNMLRTERVLKTQPIAESCMDQYMAFLTKRQLAGLPPLSSTQETFNCSYYIGTTQKNIEMIVDWSNANTDFQNGGIAQAEVVITLSALES